MDFSPLLEAIAAELGRLLGDLAGRFAAVAFSTVFILIFWALPWDRIISKAGFRGRFYSFLMLLITFPPILLAGIIPFRSNPAEMGLLEGIVIAVMGLTFYLGLWILAIAPFPKNKNKMPPSVIGGKG